MRRPLFLVPFIAIAHAATAQQVLFSEDFESSVHAFTLNTLDVGSSATGDNQWVVNNAYAGGQGSMTCMGFPFSYTVPNTPAQPAGITNANGHYLHIVSTAALASGISNCNFAAADGLCTGAANHFARMSADVSTMGLQVVTLKFWWLCRGSNNSYGEVYYSTDAGTSWLPVSAPVEKYRAQATWTQQTISMPEFAGQAALRFGFRFVNQQTPNANDPAFGLDDVLITATAQDPNGLFTGSITPSTYCPGSTLLVPYTASGAWNPGNTFTALLSDASGSFAGATPIGSVSSTFSGTVQGTIPADMPLGTGYLVKVVASSPAMEGTVSVTALTLVGAPFAGISTHVSICRSEEPQALSGHMPGVSACGAWTLNGAAVPDIIDPATAPSGVYVYTTDCGVGCPEDQAQLTVGMVEAADAGGDASITVCANAGPFLLFTQLGGTPEAGGTWSFQTAPAFDIFEPGVSAAGCYVYTVVGTAPCPAVTAEVCVAVDPCAGMAEITGRPMRAAWLGQEAAVHHIAWAGAAPLQLSVHEASGRTVLADWAMQGTGLTVDLAGSPAGIYLVRIIGPAGMDMLRMVHRP